MKRLGDGPSPIGDRRVKPEIRLPFRAVLITVCSLLTLVGGARADDANPLWGRTISAVEIRAVGGPEENKAIPAPVTADELSRLTALASGRVLTLDAVRGALDVLTAKGTVRDIRIEGFSDGDRVRLVVTWVNRTWIRTVVFEGNDEVADKDLLAAAHLKPGDEYAEDLWRKAESAMSELYGHRGYVDARLSTRVAATDDSRVTLTVRVSEGKPYRLSSIAFAGTTGMPERTLSKVTGLDPGDVYVRTDLDEGLKRLEARYLKEGYIVARIGTPSIDIDRNAKRVAVRIPVQSGPRYRILFEGNRHLRDRSLKKRLLIWEEHSVDEGVLQDSARRIESLYEEEGYPFAKVTFALRSEEPGRVDVAFHIDEGRKMWVRSIRFEGNHTFSDRVLRKLMRTHVRNRLLFHSGILIRAEMEKDVDDILAHYRRIGCLRAKVEWSRSEDWAHPFDVTVRIEEGVQTRIGTIEFLGNENIDRDTLLKALNVKSGQPYAEALGQEGRRTVLIPYSHKGYVNAESTIEERFGDDRRIVDLTYTISEGEPIQIGSIRIEGNKKTRDRVIRRELLVKPSDPYDYEKILKSQRALYQLGLFRQVRIEPERPEVREPVKDVVVSVEERPPGSVDFGLGYADVERMRGFVEVGYANFFGTARSLKARGEVSQISQKYTLSYKEPWVFGLRMDGRASAIYAVEQLTSFDRRTVGTTIGLDKNVTTTLKASLSYQYENVKPFNVDPSAILTPEDTTRTFIASLNPSLIWDRRDDPFNPASGFLQGFVVKAAAQTLGSRSQFVKAAAQSSWYASPLKPIVLALSTRGGWAVNFGESTEVPITERFFLGGRSTVRGYGQDRVGINNETIVNGTPTGGNIMLLFNGEIRIAMPYELGLVLFSDSGGIWLRSEDVSPSGLRTSVGAGLRYNTPVGPLRLDVGWKIRRHEYDVAGTPPTTVGESAYEIHFTLGQAF